MTQLANIRKEHSFCVVHSFIFFSLVANYIPILRVTLFTESNKCKPPNPEKLIFAEELSFCKPVFGV
jgi:hypothetical protein